MTEATRSRRNDKSTINYRYNPHGGPIFDLVGEDYSPRSHGNGERPANEAEARSMLSTADLISGVGQLWSFATSSLPVLRHRTSTLNNDGLQKENTFYCPAEEGNIIGSISSEGRNVSVNLKADNHVSPSVDVQKSLDSLHVAKKLASFYSFTESHICHHLLRSPNMTYGYDLQNIYGWMRLMQLSGPLYEVKSTERDTEIVAPDNTTRSEDGMTTKNDVDDNRLAATKESSSLEKTNNMMKTNTDAMSLCSTYLLDPVQKIEADGRGSGVSSNLESRRQKDDDLPEMKESLESQFVKREVCDVQIFSSPVYKPQYGLAKQEHAFAGAFAGKSIVSERGLSGLYRGIASNIASSAPISAIYTYSYESVKGALLPLFSKEYHSLAHCVAGGCASVATSFVFTPSERIKQQMQVGSHYHSCWNAFLGIVGRGGFLSLYNGWGAVLCRNVPHSIIKFYTYESLKNVMLTSHQAHAQPTTTSTLLCGGLAGSTAALFTTPFDVVKTRLQTQT
nr:kinesin, motor domain-containing protein [Tanacetum cinerariifolium]